MTDLVNSFSPISLEQMSGVKLMNRTDTKFVTTMEHLRQLLKMACHDYYIQEIDGVRNLEYDNQWFAVYGGEDEEQPRTYEEEAHGGQRYGRMRV